MKTIVKEVSYGTFVFAGKIRMPGLNEFMLMITKLGEETTFLVLDVRIVLKKNQILKKNY
jgi:hypothetical protein